MKTSVRSVLKGSWKRQPRYLRKASQWGARTPAGALRREARTGKGLISREKALASALQPSDQWEGHPRLTVTKAEVDAALVSPSGRDVGEM